MPKHPAKQNRDHRQRRARSAQDSRRPPPSRRVSSPWTPSSWQIWLASILLIVGLGHFVNRKWHGPTSETETVDGKTIAGTRDGRERAMKLVSAVQQVYQSARTYRDRTVAYVDRPDGHSIVAQVDFVVERPNRMRLIADLPATQVRLACDGDRLRAAVADEATRNFSNQFVDRPAPESIRLTTLFSAAEYADIRKPHELYSLLMGLPYELPVTSLGALLDENGLIPFLARADSVQVMPDALLGEKNCHRLAANLNGNDYILWIEATRKVLLRSEQPVPRGGSNRLVVEHHDVMLDSNIDPDEFVIRPPDGAQFVRHFVLPPADMAGGSNDLLNRPVPEMSFVGLDSGRVDDSRWQGRVAVLVWFNDHPASRSVLQHVNRVALSRSKDERVYFAAICTEPSTRLGHQDVRNIASRWSVTMPVLRDTQAVGLDVFRIEQAPTLVVVGADGTLQLIELGANEQLSEQLPIVIDKILAGENIAADFLKHNQRQRGEFERYLQLVSLDAPQGLPDQVRAEIAPATLPSRLRLQQRWLRPASDLTIDQPGNLLLLPDTRAGGRLLVLDGVSKAVVCDLDGTVLSQQPLTTASDKESVISRLQQFRSADGRWFLGTTNLGRQVHVYDARLQTVLRYPAASRDHAGIQAALLTDLNADKQPELYVAFAGEAGCESVALDGRTRWSNIDLRGVSSIAAVGIGRSEDGVPPTLANASRSAHLVVTTAHGAVMRVDAGGRAQREIGVGSRSLHHLSSRASNSSRQTSFCGLAHSPLGGLVGVGVDHRLGERWQYPLPPGAFRSQLRVVTSAQLFDEEGWHWILAGPDGSVHIVSDDGRFHDNFQVGAELRGLTAGRIEGEDWLFVATDALVTGYLLTSRD